MIVDPLGNLARQTHKPNQPNQFGAAVDEYECWLKSNQPHYDALSMNEMCPV